jgi:hypothetical protein
MDASMAAIIQARIVPPLPQPALINRRVIRGQTEAFEDAQEIH